MGPSFDDFAGLEAKPTPVLIYTVLRTRPDGASSPPMGQSDLPGALAYGAVDITLAITTGAAVLSAVAACGAWAAASAANRTSTSLAAIERDRWHADLTPEFDIACRAVSSTRAELRVELVGPVGLDRLEEVRVSIRDDIQGRARVVAGGPSAEEIAAQVWGPYRFVPGVDGADPTGRTVKPVELSLGDWPPFSLERTPPPPWSGGDSGWWHQEYAGKPVRLTLRCYHADHQPWIVPREVDIEEPSAGRD